MRAARCGGALLALVAAGCGGLPFGETIVVVDAEPSVPGFVGTLRVDFFTSDGSGTWFDSREQATPSAADWPLSFSVYTDDKSEKLVRLRLRAYPDGRVRDWRGDAWSPPPSYVEPGVPADGVALCDGAQLLAPNQEQTLRVGGDWIDGPRPTPDCTNGVTAGSAAVLVQIATADTYRFRVTRALPNGALGDTGGNTVLWLRSNCRVFTSQLACNDDLDRTNGNLLSGFDLALSPGQYTLLVGSASYNPVDATIAWGPAASFAPLPPTVPAGGNVPPPGTLAIDGIDVTPPSEPQPAVTIDRLVDVRVVPGRRRTSTLVLAGECLGTPADRPGGRSCVDASGALVAVSELSASDGANRGGPTVAGTWLGEQPAPSCSLAPRMRSTAPDGTPLFDEEVCVPGGALTVGDQTISGTTIDPAPEQPAVVAPFLMDRYEVTVGRYRQALRDGFNPPDKSPSLNPLSLAYGMGVERECTFSGDKFGPAPGIDRERHALNCISWYAARAVCSFWGGDLPTVAEWEHAARKAGSTVERAYPWGDQPATCDMAWFGHHPMAVLATCPGPGAGPVPVDGPEMMNDVTPLGLIGMAGNVTEYTRDSGRPYADACWHGKVLRGVGCEEVNAPFRYTKGGFFAEGAPALRAAQNDVAEPGIPQTGSGFRCVRR